MADSRNEAALENILGADNVLLEPMSRNEKWLHKILGEDIETDPIQSRIEELLSEIAEQGIGGVTVEPLSVTENGIYTAEEGTAYSPVTVNVAGSKPTLFAPVVTGGVNEISWANNPSNGNYVVTLAADVDGTTVTSPLTITEQMDGKTLTITASATNFQSATSTIVLSYLNLSNSLIAVSRSNASVPTEEALILQMRNVSSTIGRFIYNENTAQSGALIVTAENSTQDITITGEFCFECVSDGTISMEYGYGYRSGLRTRFWLDSMMMIMSTTIKNRTNGTITIYDSTADSIVDTFNFDLSAYQTLGTLRNFAVTANHIYTFIVNATVTAIA